MISKTSCELNVVSIRLSDLVYEPSRLFELKSIQKADDERMDLFITIRTD